MLSQEPSLTYKYSNNEAVKKADDNLKSECAELVKEIETNELVYGISFSRPFSSVTANKNDAQLLANERKLFIEKMLQVHDVHPPYIQAQIMRDQCSSSAQNEYTADSLPLLLHQFYLDRLSHCIQAKHAHLLRWRRFAEHSRTIEDMYLMLKSRIGFILSEYADSAARSTRLSQAHDAFLAKNATGGGQHSAREGRGGVGGNATTTGGSGGGSHGQMSNSSVQTEDVEIYVRWLVSHLYSQKRFLQAMKVMQWCGHAISVEARCKGVEDLMGDEDDMQKQNSVYMIGDESSVIGRPIGTGKSDVLEGNGGNTMTTYLNSRYRRAENVYLASTNAALPRDEVLNSISFLFNQDELPMHNNSIEFLRPRLRHFISLYKIDYNLSRMQTSGDEMELFAAVNRKFRHLFAQQEHMKSFRVYDIIEVGTENWGADSPIHALKKESNWIEFIQLVPMKDYIYEKEMSKIKFKPILDEFIIPHNGFIEIGDYERVQEILRENSTLVKNPPQIKPIKLGHSGGGQTNEFNTSSLWKKIYHNQSLAHNEDELVLRTESAMLDSQHTSQIPKPISFRSRSNRKLDEFNFTENLQKLGLDDSKTNDQHLNNVQGSYLSFLMLRHLRIRDLKRKALSFLNYFRSVEKTLTIYDGGLSMEAKHFKRQSAQSHIKETPYGANLGYHAYMFNNPKDFRISEDEFMEYTEIENHDDFYILDEEQGFIHVQDQRGYFIVYDIALEDFKKLEHELLQIGSYYIAKDKETFRKHTSTSSSMDSKRKKSSISQNQPIFGNYQDINLGEYSHQNVDRFAVLLDLWTNEVNFLEMKKNLFDIYYESYQNIFDKNEKRNLAQIMTNIMYKRVRYDLEAPYFTQSYRFEINCIFKQIKIAKLILDRMIDDMRNLMDKLDTDTKYGLPYTIIKKNPINLTPNFNGSTLKNVYLFEFHPCLASASRIPSSLDQCLEELSYFMQPRTVNERLKLEQSFYNAYISQLEMLDPPGYSFTSQIQKEIFSGVFVEDPQLMSDYVEFNLKQLEESAKNKTRKEQADVFLNFMARTLEMITLRHRLLEAAMETEQLAVLYRKLAFEMGFEEFHMYMRYVQFDFAKYKEDAGAPPPVFVSELGADDTHIDRYVPNSLYLAINEIEEGQIGKFSFRGKEALAQLMRPGGVENLQLILKLQITHNNALIAAIMQSHSCILNANLVSNEKAPNTSLIRNDSKNKLEDKNLQRFSQLSTNSSTNSSKQVGTNSAFKLKQYSDAFISIQLEKNPYRDLMLNEYIKQKDLKSQILSNPLEMEKLKRTLMNDYANKFNLKVLQHSLRAQLISIYHSLMRILENFPNTRDNHFVFGEPNERRQYLSEMGTEFIDKTEEDKQTQREEDDFLRPDPRTFKPRPRKLLSNDGERILNLWFIPHYTDLLSIYKKAPDELALRALRNSVRIVGALNDCLQFLLANAVMTVTLGKGTSVGGGSERGQNHRIGIDLSSWENAGGLDTELNDIQLEMNQLQEHNGPEEVAELLEAKRANMFTQYECAVRFAVRDIFLASAKTDAYRTVTENMHFALKFLNDYSFDTHSNVYLGLPDYLDPRDHKSVEFFPWRTFISRNGPFPLKYWPWYMIEPNVSLCLQGLKDIDKHVANGEILGVTLLMEDVLLNVNTKNNEELSGLSKLRSGSIAKPADQQLQRRATRVSNITLNQFNNAQNQSSSSLDEQNQLNSGQPSESSCNLIQNYAKWHNFLLTWKRVEILKLDWGRRKLGVENINTPELYAIYCENYKKDVLLPVVKILVKNTNFKETYDNFIDFTQPIVLPPQVSEYESKSKQIARLLEKCELSMIDETIHRVQKDLKLVLAERGREESTLATDLWKKSIMKEEFTINKPHIVNEFTQMLYNMMKQNSSDLSNNKSYSVNEDDLKACLIRLGTMVQEREKSNFEQYTLFYETLLRQQHQLLYNRERECRSIKSILDQKVEEINVEVQCQMADTCYDLIMEVTALRSRLQQMEMSRDAMEKELRDKVKKEFLDLVEDLVNVNTNLKAQLDHFKETIYSDVLELLSQSRQDAFTKIMSLKSKFHLPVDDIVQSSKLNQENLIKELQKDNHHLSDLIIRQKAYSKLNVNRIQSSYSRKLSQITDNSNSLKKREVENKLTNELKNIMILQQKMALKRQLATLDVEYNALKAKLDKEMKNKEAREHELQQKMKNEKNLHSAKQSNVEKLFQELETKDIELRNLHVLTEKAAKMTMVNDSRIHREITSLRKGLMQERSLKLDAFQKVDELQSQVYDLEALENSSISRPHTTMSNYKNGQRPSISSSSPSTTLTAASKLASPFPKLAYDATKAKQNGARPKTTIGRRQNSQSDDDKSSSLVAPIFYQETVTKLREVRLKSAKS